MTMKKWVILPAVALALFSAPVWADDHGGKGPRGEGKHHGKMLQEADSNGDGAVSKQEFLDAHARKFDEMDANGDGSLTEEDMKARREAKKDEWFNKMDTDGSGAISKEEFEAHREAMKDKHAERQEGRDGKAGDE